MAPSPFPSPFPALYLYPLNDSFVPKHISLVHNQHVKIGRQTNAKTTPGERNGYFDSKVLSRQHAEVWEEGGKIFIRDVKSSNGTFINGERLSPEGIESDPFELKSDDIVEFGIDIVGEDNKTIVHHKVAARVVCIFSEQDAQMAARAEQHQIQQQLQQYPASSSPMNPSASNTLMNQPGPSSSGPASASSSFNFSGQQPPRRPQMAQQGISGMGGMGGSMRPPGKSGLTFDHIITRLQGELQKSRETGAELHSVAGSMTEIHDTLGGGNLPTNAPPPLHTLPPVRPQPQQQPEAPSSQPEAATQPSTNGSDVPSNAPSSPLLTELQNQLKDTQSSLSMHVDKIRGLESALQEQEAMRQEIRVLREMMDLVQRRELTQRNMDSNIQKSRREGFDPYEQEEDGAEEDGTEDDFDDDNQSIATIVAHELERVEEEDEEQVLAAEEDQEEPREKVDELDMEDVPPASAQIDEVSMDGEQEEQERRQRQEELGRPRTPEPTGLGMNSRDRGSEPSRNRSKTLTARNSSLNQSHLPSSSSSVSKAVIDDLTSRLAALTSQLETALELSSNFQALQAQHSSAQMTIKSLEDKVDKLEGMVRVRLNAEQASASSVDDEPKLQVSEGDSLTSTILAWKKSVEGQWSSVQEEWSVERDRLAKARLEYEALAKDARDEYDRRVQAERGEREEYDKKRVGLDQERGAEWDRKEEERERKEEERERREQEREKREEKREKEWRERREWERKVEESLGKFERTGTGYVNGIGNGDARHNPGGLVTPPSPRSLSSDSNGNGNSGRHGRRRRSGSGRGRTGMRKRSLSRGAETDDTEATLANDEPFALPGSVSAAKGKIVRKALSFGLTSLNSRNRPHKEEEEDVDVKLSSRSVSGTTLGSTSLGGLESSMSGTSEGEVKVREGGSLVPAKHDYPNRINAQTAFGVLVLSVAAAAVVWRVKPQT